jgi:hypothetical protein
VDAHHISLIVVDDGKGFKWAAVTDKFVSGTAHGVEGMKERTALLGGTFKIQSQEGKGTVVRVDVPLPRRSSNTAPGPEAPPSVVVERSGTSSALAAVGSALARLGEQADETYTGEGSNPTPPKETSGGG